MNSSDRPRPLVARLWSWARREKFLPKGRDAFHVVIIAGLLGFAAFAWKVTDLMMFFAAYMVGRWHASKYWEQIVRATSDASDEEK